MAEWEEPRHPGPAVREALYSTFSHSATPLSSSVPLSLSDSGNPARKWRVCSGLPGGRTWGAGEPRAHDRMQIERSAAGLASLRGSPYASSSLPPVDVEGVRQGTSKGLDPHDSRHRAAAHLRRRGTGRRRLRRIRRLRRRRRPGLARPGLRADLRRGRGAADRGAARGRARRRGQAPADRRPRREAAPADRRRARRERRWVDVGEGLRAVARRGRGRLGEQPRGARAELGGHRGDQGRRGGGDGARPLPRGRPGRDLHRALLRRRRLRGRRGAGRERRDRRLRRGRDRGRVQAHRGHARRRRRARRLGPLHEGGRRPRRGQPRPLLRGSAAGVRGGAQAGPGHRGAARAVQVGPPVRPARAGHRRVRGRRGRACRSTPC